jgi:hypothetical protein
MTTTSLPRIALIHAVTVAMQPVEDAFRRLWPEAVRMNILDDSLSADRERDRELTLAMRARIATLARYGIDNGAQGVLFTCSAFGEAIEAAARALPVPVLKPNEAMFEEALAIGGRVGMLATFEPSIASMEQEFEEAARRKGSSASLESRLVPGAMPALKAGDGAAHDRLIAQAAPSLSHCDVVLLAHFSTARAEPAVRRAIDPPVLTSPGSAVERLKSLLVPITEPASAP